MGRRQRKLPYRHTTSLSRSAAEPAWHGDVTIDYAVDWGRSATSISPAEEPSVTSWRIVAIDRIPLGPDDEAPEHIDDLVEDCMAEDLQGDLIEAAMECDAYYAEQAADARREQLREAF